MRLRRHRLPRPEITSELGPFWLPVTAMKLVWFALLFTLPACTLLSSYLDGQPPPLITATPSAETWESLASAVMASPPPRDLVALTNSLRSETASRVAHSEPIEHDVGDVVSFWYKDLDNYENKKCQAELIYRSDNLNMWVEDGYKFDPDIVQDAARFIETRILPTNRALFGTEWQPGIDGDNRINILHLKEVGGIGAAYYWSGDEYVTEINPYSNQRELLYVSLKDADIGSEEYYVAIAHELQHLIHWHVDANEEAWLNEGLSELASHANGFAIERASSYVNQTDIQLTTLSHDRDSIGAHYAAAALFAVYFRDRFGDQAVSALTSQQANGINGFEDTLQALGSELSFNDLFADWLVASYLEGAGLAQGNYQYGDIEIPAVNTKHLHRFPFSQAGAVSQFGADYYRITSDEPIDLQFTGTQQVDLVDTEPFSGRHFWISVPADESDMTLTREFNLAGLPSATLTFWTWYEIERGWDYGYTAISADGGSSWELLETTSATADNPQGNSLGSALTGNSGGGGEPVWIQESADLTPYVGQSVLIRFQYVTDGAVHEGGFVLDDIAIPELGYFDDAESGDSGWVQLGFTRATKTLPGRFLIQTIQQGGEGLEIRRLRLDENQQGKWSFPLNKQLNEVILIISGVTPVTRQPSAYAIELTQAGNQR